LGPTFIAGNGPALGAGREGKASVTNNRTARRGQRRPRVRPLPPGKSLFTPDASPARAAAEQRSAQPLLFLHQLPPWVAPIVAAVFLVAGLAIRGPVGAVALVVVAAALAWLAAISWPRLSASGRLARALAVAAMLALAAYQATR
jgi:hypothetical protein